MPSGTLAGDRCPAAAGSFRRAVVLTMLVAVGLGALPLLVTRPTPLQDWPNHLARIHIVQALLRGSSFWARHYRLTGFFIPNAVLDLGLLGLSATGVSVAVAGQVFLLSTYAIFVGGFCALARALGAWDVSKPALAILLFYSNPLFWGLVSYTLGVGLVLGLLALWLGSERRWWRLSIAGGGAVVLVFTHAVAAAVWPLILACFELFHTRSRRWSDRVSWLLALGLVVALLASMSGGADNLSVGYSGARIGARVLHKLQVLADLPLGGGAPQDVASVLAVFVCAVTILVGRPRLGAAPALAAGGFTALTLIAPERLGSGSLLDTRLALWPVLVLAAAVRARIGTLATQAVVTAVLMRTMLIAVSWQSAGLVFRDFRRDAAMLPSGSLVMMGYGTKLSTLSWWQIWSPPILSVATQLVFRDLFLPAIFSNPAEQPIALRPAFRGLRQPWNLTDAVHVETADIGLKEICARSHPSGVYLTVLYPDQVASRLVGMSVLRARPDFLIVDACR